MDGSMKISQTVKDAYTHGKWIAEPDSAMVKTFQRIMNKDMLMASVADDYQLRLQQNTGIYLCALLGMALRDPRMVDFFNFRYGAWKTELQLTRTKSGAERKHQANISKGYQAQDALEGYGADLPSPEEEKSFFDQLRGIKIGGRRS